MPYDVADLAELAYHHLVLSEPDPARADGNLRDLIERLQSFAGKRDVSEPGWAACEGCGCWVSSELEGPEGAGLADDGGYYCTECRFAERRELA